MATAFMSYEVMWMVLGLVVIFIVAKGIHSNGDMIIAGIIQVVWGITQLILFIPFVLAFDVLTFTLWFIFSLFNGGYNEFESLTAATLRDMFNA